LREKIIWSIVAFIIGILLTFSGLRYFDSISTNEQAAVVERAMADIARKLSDADKLLAEQRDQLESGKVVIGELSGRNTRLAERNSELEKSVRDSILKLDRANQSVKQLSSSLNAERKRVEELTNFIAEFTRGLSEAVRTTSSVETRLERVAKILRSAIDDL